MLRDMDIVSLGEVYQIVRDEHFIDDGDEVVIITTELLDQLVLTIYDQHAALKEADCA